MLIDENQPLVYVLDIDSFSSTYHQVVQTIELESLSGLNRLAISSDGRHSLRFEEVKSRDLREDRTLPEDFYQVLNDDYIRFEGDEYDRKQKTGRIIKEVVNGKTSNSTYIRGHLVPQEDRNRNPGNYDPSHNTKRENSPFRFAPSK
ncbi:MAG: hypothetical protein VKJ25_17135 [Okeania sp.]|nr:hypothetical protein [Okeania sp.]